MKLRSFALILLFSCFLPMSIHAQEHHHAVETAASKADDEIQITVQQLAENIHLLQGTGGNIAVSSGPDGVLMIDADFAEITPTLLKAVQSFTDKPVKYLINTHWHGDHTGGNENLGSQGAIIIAHETVRPRLSIDNYIAAFDMKVPAKAEIGLPKISIQDTLKVHANGEDIELFHVNPAHTDGDVVVIFPKANIIHAGDIFFNGFYPFIDTTSSGNLEGMISAVERILAQANDQTKIIPGHGPIANKADLQNYANMLKGVRDVLKPLVESGKTLEEITAADPLAPFNEKWGGGILPAEKWLGIAVEALKQTKNKSEIENTAKNQAAEKTE